MDSLRVTLLVIGCLFILGIYLWEIFSRPETRKNSDILEAVDELPDVAESPLYPVSTGDHNSFASHNKEITNLGNLLAHSRSDNFDTDELSVKVSVNDEPVEKPDEDSLPLQMSVNDYEASMKESENPLTTEIVENPVIKDEVIADDEIQKIESDSPELTAESDKVDDELLVLYVLSPRLTMFNGLSISKAADEVGMIYGHMNIFHHFGPGKLHSGQPLFSMANMYEPGSFDLGKMAELKTKGIAMFMYSPASIDANVVFELFLNTTQRLSQYLGGDVYTTDHKPLSNVTIKSLREQAEALSEN